MITESTYLEAIQQENNMVATDQNKDFANCENKSEALNVVSPCNFSFIPNSNSTKLNDNDLRFENLNSETNDDVDDYSRPKKLQKNNNQGLNLNCSNTNVQSSLNNSETDFNIKKPSLNTLNKNLSLNNPSVSNENIQQNNLSNSTNAKKKTNLSNTEIEEDDEKLVTKENSATNLNFAETISAPKVPPLRIVISSSSSGRNNLKDGSISNSTSSENSSNLSFSKNYVVSSAIDSSSNLHTTNNYNFIDKRQEANDNYYTRSSNNFNSISSSSNTNSAGGRITRSQRAAAQNNSTDDSNSRYSPDELSNDYNSVSENNESALYNNNMNNQNFKIEKESNKENKDLRRRKGRGKSSQNQTSSNGSSNHIVNNSTNLNFDNGLIEETDQAMISNNPSTSNLNVNNSSRDFQMPSYNCLNMFQNIRKQVDKRRQTMCNSINPKAPQGFKDYLLNTGNYLLENRKITTHNVNPNLTIDQITVPEKLNESKNNSLLIDLFKEQDLEREKLKVQHLVEKEKVKLSIEQEILRVHSRAALAMANQSLPFSFATIMKDEEIYNTIDPENEHTPSFDGRNLDSSTSQKESSKNEYSRATYSCISNNSFADLFTLTGKSEDIGSRCRYSGRLLHSWLQDVEDKWSKIKKETIHRQKREAESLQAIQKLNWEWKVKEFGKKIKLKIEEIELETESKNVEKFNEKSWSDDLIIDELVPLVKVNEDFDFS